MFDLRVQHRDPKTGKVIKHDPYRLHIAKGTRYYERPKGSGNLWWENGEAAGRIVAEKDANGAIKEIIKEGLEHVQWVAPLSKDEQVIKELSSKDSKIAKLEADMRDLELRAIQAEQEKADVQADVKEAPKAKPSTKSSKA